MQGDLDRALIERAFTLMGEVLRDRKRFAEICLYGGSALIFLFEWRVTSNDVDVVIRSEHGAVIAARDEAARRLGLPRSWLNEGVAQYASRHRDAVEEVGLYPTPELPALRVVAARPDYLLAMKMLALGDRTTTDDRDFHDAIGLVQALELRSQDEVLAVVARFFPGQVLPLLAARRLPEVLARAAKGSA